MADAEAPGVGEVDTRAGKARDLAGVDAKAIFVRTVSGANGGDAVDIFAEVGAFEGDAVDGCTARIGEIEEAGGVGGGETKDGAAVGAAVIPGGNAGECDGGAQVELAGDIDAGREKNGAVFFCRGIDGGLEGGSVIGPAVALCACVAGVD